MSNKSTHPLCFHPTITVIVDDNNDYLSELSNKMVDHGLLHESFNDPKKAIEFINSLKSNKEFEAALQLSDEDNAYVGQKSNITFDISQVYKPIFSSDRFNSVSTAVIDYNMPEMKGDQLASLITHPHLKKLMLTAAADHRVAIDLLNHNIIDNFEEKSITGITQDFFDELLSLKKAYFKSLTKPIFNHCVGISTVIQSSNYQTLMDQVICEHSIIEYYTISLSGSKLLLDKDGNQFWLIISTDEDFDGWRETAELADSVAQSVVDHFAAKDKQLFLFTQEDDKLSPAEWENRLYPATQFKHEDKNYYYSVVCENKFALSSIANYSQFLKDKSLSL